MDEVRLAIRRLLKHGATTGASLLALGCAIAAAAATWSLMSAVLLNPLPVRDADGLVIVGTPARWPLATGGLRTGFVYPYLRHVRESGIFDGVAGVWSSPLVLPLADRAAPATVQVSFVSANYFEVLGVTLTLGRTFASEDDRRGASVVAILSERFWRTAFASDRSVIGSTITVRSKPITVIGVAGHGFRGLSLSHAPALYLPLDTIADVGPATTNYFAEPGAKASPTSGLMIVGRLPSGQSASQVNARLATLPPPPGLKSAEPLTSSDVNTEAIPAAARARMEQFARLLGWTVAMLLLIGCVTVGILLLVRTEARTDEFAMCLALGASRARLARGIAIEGALLATAGAALALPVCLWLFSAVRAFELPGGVDLGLLELTLDRRALAMASASAALATLLVAMIAGVFGFKADVADSLRSRAGATPRVARRRTRAALAATQVAVALTLVAGTGVLARSLLAALMLNQRIDGSRIVTADIRLTQHGYSPARAATFFEELKGQLAANPVVDAVATSDDPGGMSAGGKLTIDGMARVFPSFTAFVWVDDTYFDTMRLPVRHGRGFSARDSSRSPQVGIVSESFARMIAAGGDPLGRRITMTFGGKLDVEIVGVVDDVITNVDVAEPLALYMPLAQNLSRRANLSLSVRGKGDPDLTRREITSAVRGIDRAILVPQLLTLDERLLRQMAPQQFGMLVLGSLGTIALLLTVLGTYVLAETMAVMRAREMGIRAALGASGPQLAAIVIRDTGALVGLGLGLGLLLAWLGASTIRAFLFRVQPLDPLTLGGVAVGILILSIAVTLRPALRSARVDLASVLRTE